MGSGQPRPKPVKLTDARTGEPRQRERESAGTVTEAIDRRTIRQAIMTQLLTEIADAIIKSEATVTVYNEDGSVKKEGNLKTRYEKEKDTTFRLLRDLIVDPEAAFNARRNKLFIVEKPEDPSITQPFGSINLVVFRSAMALGDGNSPVDPEEVAKRVVIRAGRSSGYGERSSGGYGDRGFAGCK
jgi:hypothetical protein